jgi:putative oxidoreductase
MKDFSLLILRIVFGGLMLFNHALPKFDKLSNTPIKFPDPLGVGSDISLYLVLFSEGLCSILLVLGLFTRFASLPLVFTMSVAAFYIHLDDSLDGKEASLLYLAAYIILFAFGAGKFSLDKLIRPRAKF